MQFYTDICTIKMADRGYKLTNQNLQNIYIRVRKLPNIKTKY